MKRWNWFLAADNRGEWIVTEGYAEVELRPKTLRAILRFSSDTSPYHDLSGTIDTTGEIEATVTSLDPEIKPFKLRGRIGSANVPGDGVTTSIVLTDGTTVIGLAHGPRTGNSNA